MREIRAIVADDEPLARRGIRQLLEAHPDVVVVAECRDGRATLEALDRLAADLLFLDIQMPELDGFDVLMARRGARGPVVVFVTAYDQFAVRAFETHAIDYLVKPVTVERFAATLARVRERLATAAVPPHARRLVVPMPAGELLIDVDEIDWIEADDYYAAVHALGQRHLLRESLASLEARLDPTRFVRVHRSAIVRIGGVRELRTTATGESLVVLRNGTRIPVSRRRREQVGQALRSA